MAHKAFIEKVEAHVVQKLSDLGFGSSRLIIMTPEFDKIYKEAIIEERFEEQIDKKLIKVKHEERKLYKIFVK